MCRVTVGSVCFSLLAVFIYLCMFAFWPLLWLCILVRVLVSVLCKLPGSRAYVLSLYVTVTFKDQTAKDKALQHMAAMSSAQIVSATAIHNKLGLPGIPRPTFPGAPGVSHRLHPGMVALRAWGHHGPA